MPKRSPILAAAAFAALVPSMPPRAVAEEARPTFRPAMMDMDDDMMRMGGGGMQAQGRGPMPMGQAQQQQPMVMRPMMETMQNGMRRVAAQQRTARPRLPGWPRAGVAMPAAGPAGGAAVGGATGKPLNSIGHCEVMQQASAGAPLSWRPAG